ncbi:MAG: lipopolysaccharide export system permease protein [Saprospiraceae bacterium]
MKKIDKLLVKSFIPPFIVTFFIALFVLIMQFLWTYIDDIIGKGAGFLIIIELLSYLSISLIPTALPIAILISSVMVMGNLAERYELTSIKSAGVPLLRVMKPLMFVTFGIAIFSFFCSNYIIPLANLQFKSRLYDIRKQKPALNLEAGVFNDDFKGFIIHIGKKNKNNRDIENVIIYDHTSGNGEPMEIIAKRGEMFNTADGNFFIMKLYEGTQYQETKQMSKGNSKTYPFSRTSFKEWSKVFDLSEFNLKETDQDLFDSHHTMLSVQKLRIKIDSLELKIYEKYKKLGDHTNQYVSIFKTDSLLTDPRKPLDGDKMLMDTDTLDKKILVENDSLKPNTSAIAKNAKTAKLVNSRNKKDLHKKATKRSGKNAIPQTITKPLNEYQSIAELFSDDKQKRNLYSKAQSYARNLQSQAKSTLRSVDKYRENLVKHIFELNIKFSMALICFIFLFIGAPMGAIVRKGGFGFPILIAIFFFMIYIILNIFCKKLAESFVIPALMAAWLPCMILFPVGMILTTKAMNDSKVLDIDKYFTILKKLIAGVRKA